MQPWVIMPDRLKIALEQGVIRGVETSESRIQPNICFGDMATKQIRRLVLRKVCLQAVQRFKQSINVRVVCLLRGGKSTLVDPIVDGVVDPLIHSVNVLYFFVRKKRLGTLAQRRVDEGVKGCVEHTNNLRRLITDDCLALAIPQCRDRVATLIGGISLVIELRVLCEPVERVAGLGALGTIIKPGIESVAGYPII